MATFSDNSQEDATLTSKWVSSTPVIATITATVRYRKFAGKYKYNRNVIRGDQRTFEPGGVQPFHAPTITSISVSRTEVAN